MQRVTAILQNKVAELPKKGSLKKNFDNIKINTCMLQNQPLSFCAQYSSNIDLLNELVSQQRKAKLTQPITHKEYINLMKSILASKDESCNDDTDEQAPLWKAYIQADEELLGLAAYCALHDWHEYINNYVTGVNSDVANTYNYNKTRKLSTRTVHNVVRCLDYSLKKLDDKYGKYKGVLYRSGILDKNLKQYYATSYIPECSIRHNGFNMPDDKNKYHIIYTDNGHKIYEFQKTANVLGKFINDGEQEVLLDKDTSFQEIEEKNYTEEQANCKLKFLYTIAKEYDLENDTNIFDLIINDPKEREKYLSNILIWKTI